MAPVGLGLQHIVSELDQLKTDGLIRDYAFGGAIAAFVYIEPALTADVDVFVRISEPEGSSLDPLTKVWPALVARGAKKLPGLYLEIGGWPVQLLGPGTPLDTDAMENAREFDVGGGLMGRFIGPEHVVAICLETGRPKDYGRVEEFVRTGKVDMPTLMRLLDKFGLRERWNTFETRFLKNHA